MEPFWGAFVGSICGGILIALAVVIGMVYWAQKVSPYKARQQEDED